MKYYTGYYFFCVLWLTFLRSFCNKQSSKAELCDWHPLLTLRREQSLFNRKLWFPPGLGKNFGKVNKTNRKADVPVVIFLDINAWGKHFFWQCFEKRHFYHLNEWKYDTAYGLSGSFVVWRLDARFKISGRGFESVTCLVFWGANGRVRVVGL